MPYYCETPGQTPAAPVDWSARVAEALALPEGAERDAALDTIAADRLATTSHLVRHGGALRVAADDDAPAVSHTPLAPDAALQFTGEPDGQGGRRVLCDARLVRCPECLTPVRFVTE
jgi:hypothetical protein